MLIGELEAAGSAAVLPAVLQPGEDPWSNELLGSQRAEARGAVVGLVPLDWYRAVSSSGRLSAQGRAMARTAGLV